MMIQRLKFLAAAAIAALLVACGGGGDDTPPSFAGKFAAIGSLSGNECGVTGLQQNFATTQTVSQNDRAIVAKSGSIEFSGSVDEDNNGFTSKGLSNGLPAFLIYRTTSNASIFSMELKIVSSGCTVIYSGSATKI